MEAGEGGRTRCDWKEDVNLKKDLETYVKKNLKRKEVLDFAKEKYPLYEWSLRTLCRRLNYFGIKYIDYSIDVAEVENAVRKEITGPGGLLGYRAMHQKVREIHGLKVPRNLVNDVMMEVDPEGLKARGNIGRPKIKRKKGAFTSMGSDWTLSLDGHDKLCGFQKATFPLCIYGGLDTFSNRIQFLRIWTSNNNPRVVGLFYFDYLYDCRVLPARIRIDKGTETVELAAMHSYLLDKQGFSAEEASDAVLYGPSTENKIERWWKELHERMEGFFKDQLRILLEDGDYDRDNKLHRDLLAFVYIPVVQRELDVFRETVWNSHRGRKQKNKDLPTGIPEHIYNFPEHYGGENVGSM